MNITYYLGAGASYNAVPIVEDMPEAFNLVSGVVNNSLINNPNFDEHKKLLTEAFLKLSEEAQIFGSIDTYCRKLALQKSEELAYTKATISTFFTLWQEIDRKLLPMNSRKLDSNKILQKLDARYLGLLANYLEQKNNSISIPNNIRFITWNYDTQLERALGMFYEKEIDETLKHFNVFPNLGNEIIQPQIIHLNGIAGIYRDNVSRKQIKSILESDGIPFDDRLILKLEHLIQAKNGNINNSDLLTFAWENDPISEKAKDHAAEIMRTTDILVIIGYSFPGFNNEIDQFLLRQFMDSDNPKRIYFQDPNANKEFLNNRFDIPTEMVRIETNTKQFVLPLDAPPAKPYHEIS